MNNSGTQAADLGLSSAVDLARLMRDGEISSVELLEHYVDRIERLNGGLNAIVTTDLDRARSAAAAADARQASGEALGRLHGLPITVKDAIATAGIRTTGGAVELADNVPDTDAPVVSAVKDAGAIVFGKSNLPRWSGDVQATNPIFGTTNNAWDPDRGPGGSSGGAATAVAAGLTAFEIGTDIGGSVRLPAHFSGVCGHKPSFGIVPQHGYVSHVSGGSTEADVNVFGPLARRVEDLQVLLDVMAGPSPDRSSAWRLELPGPRHEKPADTRVAAWLDDPSCPVASEIAVLLERTAGLVEASGGAVDRSARPDVDFGSVWRTGLPLISAATTPARTAEEFAEQVARAHDDTLDPLARMRAGASAIRHRDWLLLTEARERDRRAWARFFDDYDVLLCPVSVTPAFEHQHEGNLYTRRITVDGVERPYADLVAWTSLIGYVYLPSTVVPIGLTESGLPVGIQVVAPFLEDHTALATARWLEGLLLDAGIGGYQVPPAARLA